MDKLGERAGRRSGGSVSESNTHGGDAPGLIVCSVLEIVLTLRSLWLLSTMSCLIYIMQKFKTSILVINIMIIGFRFSHLISLAPLEIVQNTIVTSVCELGVSKVSFQRPNASGKGSRLTA